MYKDEYIQTLFEYYHEERDDAQTLTPMLPSWKAENGDESPEHFGSDENGSVATKGAAHSRPATPVSGCDPRAQAAAGRFVSARGVDHVISAVCQNRTEFRKYLGCAWCNHHLRNACTWRLQYRDGAQLVWCLRSRACMSAECWHPSSWRDFSTSKAVCAGGTADMSHDDKVGEDVSTEEADMYRREVVTQVRRDLS
jgi:hypothetical protein